MEYETNLLELYKENKRYQEQLKPLIEVLTESTSEIFIKRNMYNIMF